MAKAAPGCSGSETAGEALTPDVLDDVGEGDEAGDALGEVSPVAGPGIDVDGGAAAQGDPEAVEGVEGEGDEDEGPLEDANQREGVEQTDLMAVGERAVEGFDVGEDVLDEECADGDEAGEGVQLAPEEGVAGVGAERLNFLDSAHGRMRWGGRGGCCHGRCSCEMAASWMSHKLIVSVRTIWRQMIISRGDEGVK